MHALDAADDVLLELLCDPDATTTTTTNATNNNTTNNKHNH